MKVELKNNYLIMYEDKNYYVETYEEFLNVFSLPYLEDIHEKEGFLLGLIKIISIIKNATDYSRKEIITYVKDDTHPSVVNIDEKKLVKALNKLNIAQIFEFNRQQ